MPLSPSRPLQKAAKKWEIRAGADRVVEGSTTVAEQYEFHPKAQEAGEKYNGFYPNFNPGLFEEAGMAANLHFTATKAMIEIMSMAANNSLAASTWRSYKVVLRHLLECQEYLDVVFEPDPTSQDATSFVAYLAAVKELRAESISKMLSAWRMVAITLGRKTTNLRPTIVQQVLKGLRNREDQAKGNGVRQVVTVEVLRLLKILLLRKNKNGWTRKKRQRLWAACLLNFWGGFRGCEIFSRSSRYEL